MPSPTFRLLHRAILERQQITCVQGGHYRELCPHILGYKHGEEKLLAYQFGGATSSTLPPGGQWRCFSVADLSEVQSRAGRWYSGRAHRTTQSCVDAVYVDVNTEVKGQPGRR